MKPVSGGGGSKGATAVVSSRSGYQADHSGEERRERGFGSGCGSEDGSWKMEYEFLVFAVDEDESGFPKA
jgi:hypothetical protein